VYTSFRNLEIMFHVSTLLPFTEQDTQQVERKRHLGNDIVMIVFKESLEPFYPQCITSEFNHIFAIIEPVKLLGRDGKSSVEYRVGFSFKKGIPSFGPPLDDCATLKKDESFRDFLLAKLVNGERAALEVAPVFANKLAKTRKLILNDIMQRYVDINKEYPTLSKRKSKSLSGVGRAISKSASFELKDLVEI